jgi:hypothetical protein
MTYLDRLLASFAAALAEVPRPLDTARSALKAAETPEEHGRALAEIARALVRDSDIPSASSPRSTSERIEPVPAYEKGVTQPSRVGDGA